MMLSMPRRMWLVAVPGSSSISCEILVQMDKVASFTVQEKIKSNTCVANACCDTNMLSIHHVCTWSLHNIIQSMRVLHAHDLF